jgi:hypothetical protein
MNRLNSHFLRPSPTRSRDVSGDGQSARVDKLGFSPSRSRLLTGSYRHHPVIIAYNRPKAAVLRRQSHPITTTSLQSTHSNIPEANHLHFFNLYCLSFTVLSNPPPSVLGHFLSVSLMFYYCLCRYIATPAS